MTYMPRTAKQIQSDTGASALVLVRHAVRIGTLRYGGNDAERMSHTYDIAYNTTKTALRTLIKRGEVVATPEEDTLIYSIKRNA